MRLPGPLRDILRGRGTSPGNEKPMGAPASSPFSRKQASQEVSGVRSSRGLEEFFAYIRDQAGLTILDLGGATQQNVSFITNLGHRLYSENFLQTLNDTFGGEGAEDQSNPGQIDYFLRQTLNYEPGQFDGVLLWDVLEYLGPPLLAAVMDRLHTVVRPKSYMLAFFHSDDKLAETPVYTFRIQDVNSLQLAQRGARRPAQLYNNRSLEKLFSEFESVKFFLSRDRLREVIIKA
jgi:hypothetical protein